MAGSTCDQSSRETWSTSAISSAVSGSTSAAVEEAAVEPLDALGAEEAAAARTSWRRARRRPSVKTAGSSVAGRRQAPQQSRRQQTRVLGEHAEEQLVEEVGDLVRLVPAVAQALGERGELAAPPRR